MFRNTFQHGFLSVFYSIGSHPLMIWDSEVKNGNIKRVTDCDLKSSVVELSGVNVATTFISTPTKQHCSLAIRLPFLVMLVKNMRKYFCFQVQILDDKNIMRRFCFSNFQSATRVSEFCSAMPISLSSGWNQIQINLADFTRRAYGTNYVETVRIQIHANVRLRRVYFADRLYSEDEKPAQFRLNEPCDEKLVSKKDSVSMTQHIQAVN